VALKHPIRNPSKPLELEAAEKQLKEAEAILEEAKVKAASDPNAIPVLAEPRYEEPVPQSAYVQLSLSVSNPLFRRTASTRSTRSVKRKTSSTSLSKISKKRASIHKKVVDYQGKLAELKGQLAEAEAALSLLPEFLHPEPYVRSKCQGSLSRSF